jgi:hypothetical protein
VDSAGNAGPAGSATLKAFFGPRIISQAPGQPLGPADSLTVVFDRPVDPSTFTADDVRTSIPLGTYDTPGSAYWVALADNRAYVADYSSLQIIDVSNPGAPAWVGAYSTGLTYACCVAVAGARAYVADMASGLKIFDVSNPAAPLLLGQYAGNPYAVTIDGTRAYIADSGLGLVILDVSKPAAPALLGKYQTGGMARGVTLVGTTCYISDKYNGLHIIDVSNPAVPVQVGSYATRGMPNSSAISGNLAFIADYNGGLLILDISNPAAPQMVSEYSTGGDVRAVALSGSTAVVADEIKGALAIDVSNPAAPVLLGTCGTAGAGYGVALSGQTAYIAGWGYGLLMAKLPPACPAIVTPVSDTTFRVSLPADLPDGDCRVSTGPSISGTSGTLMDQDADGVGGDPVKDVYAVTVTKRTAGVVGRQVFYNNSSWDGNNAAANAADDAAIDPTRVALLPGRQTCLANVSSYIRGLNGIMVDILGLAAAPTAADFVFKAGRAGDPSTWAAAPAPASITVRAGAGVGGSSRVTILWADGAIVGKWLQVTVLSSVRTSIPASDVFCFASLPGDIDGDRTVGAVDYLALKAAFGLAAGPAAAEDLNHDGVIGTADLDLLSSLEGQTLGPPLPPAVPRSQTAGAQSAAATVMPATLADAEASPQPTAGLTMSALANDVLAASRADAFFPSRRQRLGPVILGGALLH